MTIARYDPSIPPFFLSPLLSPPHQLSLKALESVTDLYLAYSASEQQQLLARARGEKGENQSHVEGVGGGGAAVAASNSVQPPRAATVTSANNSIHPSIAATGEARAAAVTTASVADIPSSSVPAASAPGRESTPSVLRLLTSSSPSMLAQRLARTAAMVSLEVDLTATLDETDRSHIIYYDSSPFLAHLYLSFALFTHTVISIYGESL